MNQLQKITVDDSLNIAPGLLHSLGILQMDSAALEEYIYKRYLDNPVLEYCGNRNGTDRREGQVPGTFSDKNVDWMQKMSQENDQFETLSFFLNDQIDRLQLSEKQARLCKLLISRIDDNGYLTKEQLSFVAAKKDDIQLAQKTLKSLEPPGIAAEDLRECLLLQLEREGRADSLAAKLIKNNLNDIASHYYKKLSSIYKCSLCEIENAVEEILGLEPRPGARFAQKKENIYIRPDFYVHVQNDEPIITRNDVSFPQLTLNPYYEELYLSSEDQSLKEYLKEQIADAKTLIQMVGKRVSTVERCVRIIVDIQKNFFLYPPNHLMPLSLAQVAVKLGVHQSTVSRAINGKYLEFKGKIYPLKYFFVRSVVGECTDGVSVMHIKALIEEIVEYENPIMPKTDEEIAELLRCGGCSVARRTVAKYREEMKIPSSKKRKKYER